MIFYFVAFVGILSFSRHDIYVFIFLKGHLCCFLCNINLHEYEHLICKKKSYSPKLMYICIKIYLVLSLIIL